MSASRHAIQVLALACAVGGCVDAGGGGTAPFVTLPPGIKPSDIAYTGTGAKDIWATTDQALQHWDGKAWVQVPDPDGRRIHSVVGVAAPGKLLAQAVSTTTGRISLVTIDLAGAVTEVVPETRVISSGFSGHRGHDGSLYVVTDIPDSSGVLQLAWNRWETDRLVPLPVVDHPRGSFVVTALSLSDIFVAFQNNTEGNPHYSSHGQIYTQLIHYDGRRWAKLTRGDLETAPYSPGISPSIPASTHIVGNEYFDGARMHKLGLPAPAAGAYLYWSKSGRLAEIIQLAGGSSSGSSGANVVQEVQDPNGNTVGYSQVDIDFSIAVHFVSYEFDGTNWVNSREIGSTAICGGVCYKGGAVVGVRGELNDGTIVVAGEKETNKPGFWLWTP